MSSLIIHDVPIECINHAAATYHVPAALVISVLLTENGRAGSAVKNKNGTYDYGPMQVNTVWLDKLSQYGITKEDIRYSPCINVWVGTWILSQRVADASDLSYGIGSYNSYSLPQNYHYRTKVTGIYKTLTYVLALPEDKFQSVLGTLRQQKE
jgi:hypothetical protein